MNPDAVLFFLGANFRWSLLGEEENDEDSVVNDLETYLGNYEADWDGSGSRTAMEQWEWEQMKKVVWVRRNSAKMRERWVEAADEKNHCQVVFLPKETEEETAYWIVKAVMKRL